MTVRVKIRFEEEGQDREYLADLLTVPRVGEFVSLGSLKKLQRFEVQRVLHFHLASESGDSDTESGVELHCRKLEHRELIGG